MKKLICLVIASTVLLSSSVCFAKGQTQENVLPKSSQNQVIQPDTMYDWTYSVMLNPGVPTQVQGPAGNNYDFTTTNPEGTHYSTIRVSWGSAVSISDMTITLTNVNTGVSTTESYGSSGTNGQLFFTSLPKGTFKIMAKSTGVSGSSTTFHVYTEDLVS